MLTSHYHICIALTSKFDALFHLHKLGNVKYINFTSHPKHATGDHIKLSNRKFLRDIHEKRKKLQKLL